MELVRKTTWPQSRMPMKTCLSITCGKSGVVSVPAVSSRIPILRRGTLAEKIQRLYTSNCLPHLRHRTAPRFVEADEMGSYRHDQGFCSSVDSHFVGLMPEDSKDAQGPKVEDPLQDEVRDEYTGKAQNRQSGILQSSDDAISTIVTGGLTLERTDSIVVSRLPPSHNGRVEELVKVLETLNRTLLSVLEQVENLVRQKETLNGSGNLSQVATGSSQSATRRGDLKPLEKIDPSVFRNEVRAKKDQESPRSRMEIRERIQKREAQRILTGNLGSKLGNGKLNRERAAVNTIMEDDERFMGAALEEARKGAMAGEVPVGAIIVQNGKVVARAYNRVESDGDPTAHAEMLCLRSAARYHGDWRLVDATLYVTLEPCPMCAGAILQSRVKGVVWGSRNTLLGADGSWVSLFPESVEEEDDIESTKSEHEPCSRPITHPFHTSLEVRRGVLAEDCATVMRNFFKTRRKANDRFVKTKPGWLPLPVWVLFKRLLHWLTFLIKH